MDPSGSAPLGAPVARPGSPSHVRRVLQIWVVLSVIGVALVIVLAPIVNPTSASATAGFANLTDLVFTAIAVPIGLFVWVFVFYSLYTFRAKAPASGRVEDLEDGPPLQASGRQQVAWLAITGAIAIFLVGWGMFGFYKQTTDPPGNPLVVDVTGQQWTWTYSYRSLGLRTNMLELPVGHPVEFRVTSDDVLHGFVIDALGVAMDGNPGQWSTVPTVTPTRVGNYTARCVELCGLYHTYMWSRVRVVSSSAFAAWVRANRGNSRTMG
jgi:cytochrome c oxidase subunit II